jgi:hypothetical protein
VGNASIALTVLDVAFAALSYRSLFLQHFRFIHLPEFDFSFGTSRWKLCAPDHLCLLEGNHFRDNHRHVVFVNLFADIWTLELVANDRQLVVRYREMTQR